MVVLAIDPMQKGTLMSAEHRFTPLAAVALATALLITSAPGGLAALAAAGLKGEMPVGGEVITGMVATLQSNWEWLVMTGIGLVLMIVAGLMIFGSQRAPDHLARIIGGVLLILVVIPAVLK